MNKLLLLLFAFTISSYGQLNSNYERGYKDGYCKAKKEDKDVKIIFHEMPILGPTSRSAAQWALAAHNQNKYFEYLKKDILMYGTS